jgi:tetratricopeptide (TPR) repeat protein
MRLAWLALAAVTCAAGQDLAEWEQARAAGRRAFEQGRYREAEPLLSRALVISRQLAEPDSRVVRSLHDLADLHRASGRHGQAEELLRAALVLREKEAGADSPTLVADVDALAWAVYSQAKLPDAARLFRRSLALVEKSGDEGLPLITALINLARAVQPLRQDKQTVALLERVIATREKLRGQGHPEVAGDLMRLGRHHGGEKRAGQAIRCYVQALAILEQANGPMHISLTSPLDELGTVHASQKDYESAEPYLRRSVTVREWTNGPLSVELAPALENLAAVWAELKRLPEAEEAYRAALALWELKFGPAYPLLPVTLDRLAAVCAAQQKFDKAELYFSQALAMREKDVVANLNNVALVVAAEGKNAEAEPYYKSALSLMDKPVPKPSPELLKSTLGNYRDLLLHLQRRADAAKVGAKLKAAQ